MSDTPVLLTSPHNFAVVQLPERKYPGVVVQGDTLHGLVQRLVVMKTQLSSGELDQLQGEIEDMRDLLAGVLASYEAVCQQNSVALPYPQSSLRPVS
jgi:hypothetical protein